MSEYDLHSSVGDRVAFRGDAINSDTTTFGEIIDTIGFELAEFIVTSASISGTFTVLLEQGDDAGLSDASVVSSDETLGDLPQLNDDNMIARVGAIGKKRYQRMSWVSTGVTGSSTLPSYAILGRPHTAPVAQ